MADAVRAACVIVADHAAGASVRAELERVESELMAVLAQPHLLSAAGAEAVDEVDVALDQLIGRLSDQDQLTGEHSRAVALWCARLADELALDDERKIHLSRCGLIHDIGKLSTPLEILNAPRRLTDTEMQIMRAHSADGFDMIKEIPMLARFAPAVRQHHERMDGAGYPDGLRMSQILEDARIVAVADAFNAMIGNRPYRPPFAPATALERLYDSRGTHFDPEIVDAMVRVVTNRA